MRPVTPVLLAAAALALAGCSDPELGSPLPTSASSVGVDAPSSAPTPTGSAPTASTAPTAPTTSAATPDPSATPVVAPTLPPEATTNDAAGAEAFVRYWYDTLNYAYATGDTDLLLRASNDACAACNGLAEVVDSAYANAGRIEGGLVELREVVAPEPDATGAILLSIVFDQAASTQLDSQGLPIDEQSASNSVSQSVVLQRGDEESGWTMFGLAQ